MAMTKEELEFEAIKLHEAARSARQKELFNFITGIANLVMGCVNAGLLVSNRQNSNNMHAETVQEVQRVYKETPSYSQVEAVEKKMDANLMQWKAYKTKNPDDETKAAEVLTKVVEKME